VKPKRSILLLVIAFGSYLLLGIPSGFLGVAWPSIRHAFDLSLDALGALLITGTIGYILSSFNSGRLISRFGIERLLIVSSVLITTGTLGYAVAPLWWIMVAAGLAAGLGNGFMDACLNVYLAQNYDIRHMNWLHACFGIGTTVGPMVMTAILHAGWSWRWGYMLAVSLDVMLVACFIATRKRWSAATAGGAVEADAPRPAVQASSLASLRLPLVWVCIVLFMIHTGVESVAGQWSYTLFTEGRAIAPTVASLWTSVYWGCFTASRLVLGSVADRVGVDRMLRVSMLGIVVGSALLWWNVTEMVSFLGLAVVGLGVALLFPSMMSSTPRWLGVAHATNAIGFHVAASSAGITILSGLVGVLAERLGLEVVGPVLVVSGLAMLLLFELLVRGAARRPAAARALS
jgi:fucose permease